MGVHQSTPNSTKKIATKKRSVKSKSYNEAISHQCVKCYQPIIQTVHGFIRSIEIKYCICFPVDIIPIIIRYYSHSQSTFGICKLMTIQDFEFKGVFTHKLQKDVFTKIVKCKFKITNAIYAMHVQKKHKLQRRRGPASLRSDDRDIIANINHPFIVSSHYTFESEAKIYIIMDFFVGTELLFYLEKDGMFTETKAKFYSAELCLAIECLHLNGIIYKDLKPEYIFIDSRGHIKLTDVNRCNIQISNDGGMRRIIHRLHASPEYMAPELLHQRGYGMSVDWWAFGLVLYEMICGKNPFYFENLNLMYTYESVLHLPIPPLFDGTCVSETAVELMLKILERDPVRRIECGEIKSSLFFTSIDWNALYNQQINPP